MDKNNKNIKPADMKKGDGDLSNEKPISAAYPAIDTDLARDNLENHLSAADLQDL